MIIIINTINASSSLTRLSYIGLSRKDTWADMRDSLPVTNVPLITDISGQLHQAL